MKTKKMLLVCAVLCAVIFSGCGKKTSENASDENNLQLSAADQETEKEAPKINPNITFADLVSSIEENKKLDCKHLVKDEETLEQIETHTYVDGEKYKSITYTTDGDTLYSIFDGETFYFWSKKSGQGFKMAKTCAEQFGSGQQENDEDREGFELDTFKAISELFDEKGAINCVPTDYVDVSIPAEVVFADQCEMLKTQMEEIKRIEAEDVD